MNELKFACPLCGQHITCDSAKSGAQVDCPTCFQKLLVPDTPTGDASKLILKAALVSSRRSLPKEMKAVADAGTGSCRSRFPVLALALVALVCAAAGALFTFREKIFKTASKPATESEFFSSDTSRVDEKNWSLDLAKVAIPDARASGRISGRSFSLGRAVLKGGILDLRQGRASPPDVGLTINLFANRGEDLAGQPINIEASRTNSPKVILRTKDSQGRPITQSFQQGYALRLEFAEIANGTLPGRIYFCAPDAARSWVAGTFAAEIRKPQSHRIKPPAKPRPAT